MSELLARARRTEIDSVLSLLRDREVVGVVGARGDSADEVCRAALSRVSADTRVAVVDLHRCSSAADVADAFARAAAGVYVREASWQGRPRATPPASGRDDLVALADAAPDLARYALDQDGGILAAEPAALVEAAVDAIVALTARGTDAVLGLLGAEAIAPGGRIGAAEPLTWNLRGRLQQAVAPPALVLGGAGPVETLLRDQSGALFGWGSLVHLAPDPAIAGVVRDLLAEAGRPAAAVLGQQVAAVSEGDLGLATRLLDLMVEIDDPDTALDRAWRIVSDDAEPTFPRLLALVGALDRLGVPVLRAVAEDRPPYGVAGHPSGPNRTLRRLQAAGLIWQMQDRKWRLADPLFAAWLRRPAVTGRLGTGPASVYDPAVRPGAFRR